MQARCLIVTHGGKGALVVDDRGEQWVAAKAVANPVDICGAGDSFSAGAAMALVVTGDPLQAAQLRQSGRRHHHHEKRHRHRQSPARFVAAAAAANDGCSAIYWAAGGAAGGGTISGIFLPRWHV